MSLADDIERVERDRKQRENGLALLLLALAERARVGVVRALRVGAAWGGILRGVLLGDDSLDLRGGVPLLSRGMADSHLAGHHGAGLLAGVRLAQPAPLNDLADLYRPAAGEVLTRIHLDLSKRIERGLGIAAPEDRIAADVREINTGLRNGWSPEKPRAARVEAERAVTQTYAAGMAGGMATPQVVAVLTGGHFVNPLDAVTTDICRKRAGTKLPMDHPWWFRNWPPLHDGCRSFVLPLTTPFTPRENPPEFPMPEPGWGQWAGFLSNKAYP